MHTRRIFLVNSALAVSSSVRLERTPGASHASLPLPEGVIAPYVWTQPIPISGQGAVQTSGVDEAVIAAMRQNGIVGCGVCIVHGNTIRYAKGFGYAELDKIPFLPTTTTRCGSLAKPLTALCALMLFDQKKLDLDEKVLPILKERGIVPKPVGSMVPDDRISRITVRHLMDHTSGLPNGATYTAWRQNRNVAALHQLNHIATGVDVVCDALGNTRLEAEPGTKYQYANANFVLLARVIEAKSNMYFPVYLSTLLTAKFKLKPDDLFVSQNQDSPRSRFRGAHEAAYYQTSEERYVSFVPSEQSQGRIYGEAYRGYATESSDGAGGIACSASALGQIIADLQSSTPALSPAAIREIVTPPNHYKNEAGFDPTHSGFYSKGFDVRYSGGRPWLSHGGMTNHCGGVIGYNAGYQFVAVSNWNNARAPFVDSLLNRVLTDAMLKLNS